MTLTRGRGCFLIAAMFAVACGTSGSDDDDGAGGQPGTGGGSDVGGSGGQPSSGGSSGAGSGSGGTSATGSGGSAATGSGGSAGIGKGGSGATSGSGGAPPAQTCDALQGRVAVDGMVFSFPLARAANIQSDSDTTDLWSWGTLIGDYGFLSLTGSGAIKGESGQPIDGSPLRVDHAVLAPNIGDDSLGTMYGVAPGTASRLVRHGAQIDLELEGVAVLQGCGDFPVNGQIDLCHRADGSPCPTDAQGGKLGDYDWDDEVTSWTLTDGTLRASVGDQGGVLRARMDASGTGPLRWAHLSTSLYGHYDGKIVCAGTGSDVEQLSDATGAYTVIHLRNLAWLEGPGAERAAGCVR